MNCLLPDELTLYEIVGKAASIDRVTIVPALYEFFPELQEDDIDSNYSFDEYLSSNDDELSKNCLTFARFCQENSSIISGRSCDIIWVHAKVIDLFQYYPPSIDWRYYPPDFPFLAIIVDDRERSYSIHPFVCIECDFQSYLEFSNFTSIQDRSIISNAFWKLLLLHPGLSSFEHKIKGNYYDDYESVCMGSDFITGYNNNQFYLEIVWQRLDV